MNDSALSDALRIADLLRRERASVVDVLLALAEFDRLGLYRPLGFATFFDYLHRELRFSRGMAHYRLVAARLVARFPDLVEPLRDGRLCLSTVVELARVVTGENCGEVLPKFFGKSREEAKQVVADLLPASVVPVRTVVTGGRADSTVEPRSIEVIPETPPSRMDRPVGPSPRTVVEPLTREESRMHVTVSPAFLALLKRAKAGQGHVQPGATDEQVLTTALELLVAQQERRRASVPPRVKREVMKRDEGRCQWPVSSGGVCGSEVRVQIDHVVPRGRGGPSTVANSRVLCDIHNREAARQVYGDPHMDLFTRPVHPKVPVAREPAAAYRPRSGISFRGPNMDARGAPPRQERQRCRFPSLRLAVGASESRPLVQTLGRDSSPSVN